MPIVLELVDRLLAELDGDSAMRVGLDVARLTGQLLEAGDRFTALLATTTDDSPAGVATAGHAACGQRLRCEHVRPAQVHALD